MSGSPVGECEICGETMYECEWMFTKTIMHHETCNVAKVKTIKYKNKLEAMYDLQERLSVLGIISKVNERKSEIAINMYDNLNLISTLQINGSSLVNIKEC